MFTRTAGHGFQYRLLFTPAEDAFITENLLLMAALYCLVYLEGYGQKLHVQFVLLPELKIAASAPEIMPHDVNPVRRPEHAVHLSV